jgi:hypothetical protein
MSETQYIVRTIEEDKEYAMFIVAYAMEKIKTPVKEPYYLLSAPEIQEKFPGICIRSLQDYCLNSGKKPGIGGYRIKLSEIEKLYNQENGSIRKTKSKRNN